MGSQNAINSDKPVDVKKGGTGLSSWGNTNAVLLGGTTTTSNFQNVASNGTLGQFLISNGSSANPTFQSAGWVLIEQQTITGSTASLIFSTGLSGYSIYALQVTRLQKATTGTYLIGQISTDGGSTWITTGYGSSSYNNPYNSTTMSETYITTGIVFDVPSVNTVACQSNNYMFGFGSNRLFQTTGMAIGSGGITSRNVGGYNSVVTPNALKLFMNSGNLTVGRVNIWGLTL